MATHCYRVADRFNSSIFCEPLQGGPYAVSADIQIRCLLGYLRTCPESRSRAAAERTFERVNAIHAHILLRGLP